MLAKCVQRLYVHHGKPRALRHTLALIPPVHETERRMHEQGIRNLKIKRHPWLSQSQETIEMAQLIQWSKHPKIGVHEMPLCVSLGHRTSDKSLPEPVMTRFTDMCWDRWLPRWKRQWLQRPTLKYALSTRCNTCMQVGKQHVTSSSMLYQEID